jgi:hypothetical protein
MQSAIQVQQPTGPIAPEGQSNADRPAWLPENFKSPEDLAKSYQSLQAEYTKMKQGNSGGDGNGSPPAAPPPAPAAPTDAPKDLTIDMEAAKAAASAGLDVDKLSEEFMAEGKLKDESYSALEKAGIPKSVVDDFIRLKQGEAASVTNEVMQIAGGQESFQQMIQWAANDYADAATYNQMISSGDPATMRMAMTALKAAYTSANGQSPNLVMGGNGASGADRYADDRELMSDMAKPEYRTDIAFRRRVEAKLARSPELLR